jgi:hypothetical protein
MTSALKFRNNQSLVHVKRLVSFLLQCDAKFLSQYIAKPSLNAVWEKPVRTYVSLYNKVNVQNYILSL